MASRLLQRLKANLAVCEINEGSSEEMALIDIIGEMEGGDGKTLVVTIFPVVRAHLMTIQIIFHSTVRKNLPTTKRSIGILVPVKTFR